MFIPKNDNPNDFTPRDLFGMPSGPQTPFNTLAQLRTIAKQGNGIFENQAIGGSCDNTISTRSKPKRKETALETYKRLLRQTEIAKEMGSKVEAIIQRKREGALKIQKHGLKEPKLEREQNRRLRREANITESKRTIHQLRKKIRDKHFSYEIVMSLILNNPTSELKYSYLNTLNFCQTEYKQEGKTLTSKYCNNRFCYSCNRIRTGKMINNYLPVMERMDDLYFVTLTIPNCKQEVLRDKIKGMINTFQLIKDAGRKQWERGKGAKFSGLRKLECTYNQARNDYHPHFHLVVKGLETATNIVESWLQHYPEATPKAQDIKPATLNSVKELFKYFTKFWSSKQDKKREFIPVDYVSLNNIFVSIRGLRIFQPFGLDEYKIDESEEIEGLHKQIYNIPAADCNYSYTYEQFNFIDYETGAAVTDFKFSKKDARIFTDLLGYDGLIPIPLYTPIKKE